MWFPCMWWVIFFLQHSRSSLWLWSFWLWHVWCGSLCFYPTWNSLSLLNYRLMFFIKFGKFLFIKIFFSIHFSPSGTPITCIVVHLMVSYISLRICWVFFVLLPLCSSDHIISINLSSNLLILSSASSSLMLTHSSKIFILLCCTFQLQDTYLVLFNTFSLLIFSIWGDIVIMSSFNSLCTVLLSSLSIFKITTLMSFLISTCRSLRKPTLFTVYGSHFQVF